MKSSSTFKKISTFILSGCAAALMCVCASAPQIAQAAQYGKVVPYSQGKGSQKQSQSSKNSRQTKAAKSNAKTSKKAASSKKNSPKAAKKNATSNKKSTTKSSNTVRRAIPPAVENPVSDGFISYDAQSQARREAFLEARDLARAGDVTGVERYKAGVLRNYALNVYLDYYLLQSNVSSGNYNAALNFVRNSGDKELSLLLTDTYADMLGGQGQYKRVLEIMGSEPYPDRSPLDLNVKEKARECRWHEAALETNRGSSDAVAFASKLYVSASSYPEACSGLISAWASKGYMSNAAKARRFETLLKRRKSSSAELNSAAQSLEGSEQNAAIEAASIADTPDKYIELNNRRARVLAFERYAALNPNDATEALPVFSEQAQLSSTERHEILGIIASGRLGYQSTLADLQWVDDNLPAALWTDDLVEKRLRRAIWYKQWKYIVPLCDAMGERGLNEVNWQYWKARGLINTGKKNEGLALMREVAKDRSFFGFVAAQFMGQNPHYGNTSLKRSDALSDSLTDVPAVQRFLELYAMNDPARFIEWREIATNTDEMTALSMAEWALRTGNHSLAISAVAAGKRWDALDYRFPTSYLNLYRSHAQRSGVALSYLYGISRQESMLNPVIRSPVGATGLMQLMPATAQLIARKNGWSYQGTGSLTDPDTNIRYGSEYLRELLGKFSNNRVLASAGYNAGPGRVYRWTSQDGGKRDAPMYIENIPFTETRGYVQRVLLYSAIYEKLINGKNAPVLTQSERNFSY